MKNRDVNIFSVSFLDLLSGALAAVIILFVIVPKMDSQSRETKEVMEALDLKASELEDMVKQLENSVDSSVFKEVVTKIKEIESELVSAKSTLQSLEKDLESAQRNYDQARRRVARLNREVNSANDALDQERRRVAEVEGENERLKSNGNLFGVDAELAIVYKWTENADVDIHLYSEEYGTYCSFNATNTPFAKYLRDEVQATDDSYEMVYQTKLVPGTYKVYINLYQGDSANPNGYIHVLPGTANDRKYDLGSVELNEANMFSNGVFVRRFMVNAGGIRLL